MIYQMPDKAWIDPEVFKAAGVMPDIFVDREQIHAEVEIGLISKADAHGRSYGMGAVDDLLENCLMANGLFYYKELPSLNRLGNNTLLLEAMTVGYELTGDTKYLEAGRTTFWSNIRDVSGAALGDKRIVEDAVIVNGGPTKSFAQSCVPLSVYYKAIADAGML